MMELYLILNGIVGSVKNYLLIYLKKFVFIIYEYFIIDYKLFGFFFFIQI